MKLAIKLAGDWIVLLVLLPVAFALFVLWIVAASVEDLFEDIG